MVKARFRADPTKVRVSIRQYTSSSWCVTVYHKESTSGVSAIAGSPSEALDNAIYDASKYMDGIDRDMQSWYIHPQK